MDQSLPQHPQAVTMLLVVARKEKNNLTFVVAVLCACKISPDWMQRAETFFYAALILTRCGCCASCW
jgi:hypothetical protein